MKLEGASENKPWKNERERDLILTQYLMEKIEELPQRELARIGEKNLEELDPETSDGFLSAAKKYTALEYIQNWAKRHRVQIDIPKLIKEGEKNFELLRRSYEVEFGGEAQIEED